VSAVAETQPRRLTFVDRIAVGVPLASIYLWLCIVYCVEAWKRVTPWLFTDELEFTQIQRSIAATGHPARRGQPHSFESLYNVLVAPIWLIHDVSAAFATIKYVDTLIMASVLFPTYFLARMVVGRTPALFAAAGAAAIPSLAYSSWIVEETLAYPYSALCLFLIAKALRERSRGWVVGAVVASAVAPLVRGELAMIPVAFVLALLFMAWSSERAKARRATWTVADWVGAIALVAGAIILVSGILSHYSQQWLMDTAYNWTKKRIFVYGDWAAGALAVGLGVAPVVLGLASLVPLRREARTPELRIFRCVATGGIIAFGLYTGMKAAYLSQVFGSRVEERNLIYIAPLLFVGTALVLERRRVNLWALAAAAIYTLYIVVGTPLQIGGGLYSDALGLAILQQANRYFLLGDGQAQWILIGVLVVTVVAALALGRLRRPAAVGVAALLGVLALAWNVTGEIAAAAGNVTVSRDLRPTLGEPFTWVDDHTHLKPTLYLGQAVIDPNPEALLEFWNRSITTVSTLDGSIKGPGPSGAPNITPTGQLYWTLSPSDPGKVFAYAVADGPCINFVGPTVAVHRYLGGVWRLVRLTRPNRLSSMCVGIYSDGWSGANDSTYFRFVGHRAGWLRVTLSRQGFPGSPVDIRIGTIERQENQPVLGRVLRDQPARIVRNRTATVWVRTPASPFGATVVVRNKFSPNTYNHLGDVRSLGALVTYRWFAHRPRG
jgi:hypothetical protein